ncbi:MAG: hypothetical protein AAB740_04135 [Patescibacteria group bacterium]
MEKEIRGNSVKSVEGEKNVEFLEFKRMIADLQKEAEKNKREGSGYSFHAYSLNPNNLTTEDFDIYKKWESGNLSEKELEECFKNLDSSDKKYPFAHWLTNRVVTRQWLDFKNK